MTFCLVILSYSYASLIDDEEGEFRPLLPKTDRESVLRGEDYWIDYREVRIILFSAAVNTLLDLMGLPVALEIE